MRHGDKETRRRGEGELNIGGEPVSQGDPIGDKEI